MGTASLVFGLILIGFGLLFSYAGLEVLAYSPESDTGLYAIAILIVIVPLFGIGGLLLRKYDRDRKEK